jgi:riboflavin kinase/FMN adenylyltransferase
MRLDRHLAAVAPAPSLRLVAIGAFDAMHVGHQRVLARLVELAAARGAESVVALRPPPATPLLSLRRRLIWLREGRVDRVVCLSTAAGGDDELIRRLGATAVVVGHDVALPPNIGVERVESACLAGDRIGSAAIRTALQAGDIAGVRARLGRDPSVDGRIVHGFHRGAPLGIPTANLRVRDLVLPVDGVDAVRARLQGRDLQGVANIGFNPTFGNRVRSVETHLFDFSGDVYGQRLEIAFVARLRGEQKFAGVDALLAQIRSDIAAARRIFDRSSDDG